MEPNIPLVPLENEVGAVKSDPLLETCEKIEGVVEEIVALGVLPETGKVVDPIKDVLLLPVLKNAKASCAAVVGLDDPNGELSATFPSEYTEMDLSDNRDTETGADVDAAAPK